MKSTVILCICYVALTAAASPPSSARPSECMAKRPTVKPTDCCTGSVLIDPSALEECKAEYPNVESEKKRPGPSRGTPCVVDCYFNKTGIFVDGQAVKAAALDILGKSLDASMTSVLNEGIDKCIEGHQNMKQRMGNEKFPPPPPEGGGPSGDEMDKKRCRPDAKMFLRCIQHYMFFKCPAEKVVQSEECGQFKEFAEKCMPPMN